MIDPRHIAAIAEKELAGTDLFVVGCQCSPGNEIELTIDSDTSVSIDDCTRLSRAVEAALDRDAEDFSLTVASAGIGSDLRCLRQFRKLTGRPVEVLLASGVKLTARLVASDEAGITVSYEELRSVEGRKRKQSVRVERSFAFAEIKSAREYLDYK